LRALISAQLVRARPCAGGGSTGARLRRRTCTVRRRYRSIRGARTCSIRCGPRSRIHGRTITRIGGPSARRIGRTVRGIARSVARICWIPWAVARVTGAIAAMVPAPPVAVPYVHIAVINDRAAVPVRAPAAPAPSATTTMHHRSYGNAHTEGENPYGGHVGGAVSRGDNRSAVDYGRIVRGHVHNLRICRLNDDRLGLS